MKTKLPVIKLLVLLFSIVATTSVFGQLTTYIWTNQTPANGASPGDLGTANNWNPNGVPSGGTGPDGNGLFGDELQWNGLTTGPLNLVANTITTSFSGSPSGVRVHLTPSQTSRVSWRSLVAVGGGVRIQNILIESGAGGLTIGDGSTNIVDIIGGGVLNQIHGFTNNSTTAPSIINMPVRWRMGGGGNHFFVFEGPGDWVVNNQLNSQNGAGVTVQKFGTGTMTWTVTNDPTMQANLGNDLLNGPLTIGGGTLIMKTANCITRNGAVININHNGVLLKYDAAVGAASWSGNIAGAGPLEVSAGSLTLAGASTFSGNINLTGGELIAGSTENVGSSGPLGQGGTISFNGGTLGWNLANAFDYSSRFNTAAGQVYNLDTGGSSPTLLTGLSSSGGTLNKTGGGTLTLAGASTYTGATTVGAGGSLVFQGTKSGNANITVADTGTLGVFENDSQITPTTLTLGQTNGMTLEFNNVTNHTTATLAPSSLTSTGMVTINVNSGRFILIGETFPLLKWTSGTAPATTLGFLAGAGGHLTTNLNEIDLVIDDPPYIWTGANSAVWDTLTVNWVRNALPTTWANSGTHYALFDDSSTVTNVSLSGIITATNVTISSSQPYAITNSAGNVLSGPGSLTKAGVGSLVLPGGANNYTGITTLGGGVLLINVLANGLSVSDIGAAGSAAGNVVFNSGTLQYNGPSASIDRLFSVGPGGGTIDNEGGGTLAFNNSGALGMVGNGPRALTLTGPGTGGADTLACNIANHPAGTSLRKTGPGTWILTGASTYAGGTTLLAGALQVGATGGGASGTLGNGAVSTVTGTVIDFERTGSLTVNGGISGGGSVTNGGTGTLILAGNSTYGGGTTIGAGTLQVGNGGSSGSLSTTGPIVNNSLLIFNTTGSFEYNAAGIISGSGNVIVQGGGTIKAIGNNIYTGWTRIDANTTFFVSEGQTGTLLSSMVTNNGTLRIVSQDGHFSYAGPIFGSGKVQVGVNNFNVGAISTFTGTNSYSGGTLIGGDALQLGDNSTTRAGEIVGNVQFVNNFTTADDNNRILIFNRPDSFTFSGTITTNFTSGSPVNLGTVQQNGSGTLTLTGNNNYGSGTVINAGTVVVGNGGTLGFGGVTDNSALIFNTSGNVSVPGAVTGGGALTLLGSGKITLPAANNTFLGATTVSNGTLVVRSLGGGDLSVEGGTVVVGGVGVIANLNVNNMNIDSGTIVAYLNRAASPLTNGQFTVAGALNHTGGSLKLYNAGPALQVGDKFTIFSQPVPGGATIPIFSPGCTLSNSLASDGSVVVTSAQPLPTISVTNTSASTNNLTLSWPAAWTGGVVLQNQTDRLNQGMQFPASTWTTIPGTDLVNSYTTTIAKTNGMVLYRFALP